MVPHIDNTWTYFFFSFLILEFDYLPEYFFYAQGLTGDKKVQILKSEIFKTIVKK